MEDKFFPPSKKKNLLCKPKISKLEENSKPDQN